MHAFVKNADVRIVTVSRSELSVNAAHKSSHLQESESGGPTGRANYFYLKNTLNTLCLADLLLTTCPFARATFGSVERLIVCRNTEAKCGDPSRYYRIGDGTDPHRISLEDFISFECLIVIRNRESVRPCNRPVVARVKPSVVLTSHSRIQSRFPLGPRARTISNVTSLHRLCCRN
ncbi:hypothetical protein EVAR_100485_1 [Eumeta japonica]|uniref:Uncharacterized protein n=1 Tax=Eumeta variegata TaxID=151549 RepID=A0A4C1SJH7_EUMVA|nr:hypothetical protein EVAR_100485_1 [Eumeta japonica]